MTERGLFALKFTIAFKCCSHSCLQISIGRVALMEEGNAHESNVEDPLVDAAEKVDHDRKECIEDQIFGGLAEVLGLGE